MSLFRYSSPQTFYPLAGKMVPWFLAAAAVLAVYGLYVGFFVAPTDFQQGESYRIIFIHVPAAWMSMFIYVVMAFWAGVGLVQHAPSSMMATALALTGAPMTFTPCDRDAGQADLVTWWVWDARVTPS
jgi:heme exporter protein C